MATLYALTVDTEEEWDWRLGWPVGRPSVENVKRLARLQRLCSDFGVATTYFANWAVMDDRESRTTILELAGHPGVEIGMHLHPWNTPPLAGSGPVGARDTFLHNLPGDVAREKLDRTYRAFGAVGLAPTSFRGGRYSSGPACRGYLRDAGFLADSSVVAYTTWDDDGAPDYRERGPEPVRLPPRHVGDRAFWEIPVTRGFTRRPAPLWRKCFQTIEGSGLRKLHLIGLADRLGIVSRVVLSFDNRGERIARLLRRLRSQGPTCLCFTLHSSTLLPGGNPYTGSPADVELVFRRMASVFETLAGWAEFRPATVSEIAMRLEEGVGAGPRELF